MAVFDDDPAGGKPFAQDVLQGLSHGRRALAGAGDNDSVKTPEVIEVLTYPKPVPRQFNVTPDRFFRIHGPETGHEDLGEYVFEVLIQGGP